MDHRRAAISAVILKTGNSDAVAQLTLKLNTPHVVSDALLYFPSPHVPSVGLVEGCNGSIHKGLPYLQIGT
jgi:hypothetical protein